MTSWDQMSLGTESWASPSLVSASASCENVSAPKDSTTAAAASVSSRLLASNVRTEARDSDPITSGSSSAAAAEVRVWVNWSSATPTSSTSTPVSLVNRSMMASVALTRSGRVSVVHTVMESASAPESSPPHAAGITRARRVAAAAALRRFVVDMWGPLSSYRCLR